MSLIALPDDGIGPILSAINKAKTSIDIGIFRLNRADVSKALRAAVARGVPVRTLIAHTNRGGDKRLRQLEQDLLKTGASVRRTDDDLRRYHNKIMIVDRSTLYVLGFNYTVLDVDKSRSFGLITKNRVLVQEAIKLFQADSLRLPYAAGPKAFLVSPVNARERLAIFLRGARKQLLVYDPKLTDPMMIRILHDRMAAGVSVRILGQLAKTGVGLSAETFPGRRLHVRAIIRDGRHAFLGSQGLRKLELDGRREVGVIVRDPKVVSRMGAIFERDWALTDRAQKDVSDARKDAKAVIRIDAEAKADAKAEVRGAAEAQIEAKEAARVDAKAEAKAERKEEKAEGKAEKREAKAGAKAEEKAEAHAVKVEKKAEARAEEKAEERAEAKEEAKQEAKQEAKADKKEAKADKKEAKAEAKELKAAAKGEGEAEAKVDKKEAKAEKKEGKAVKKAREKEREQAEAFAR